MRVSSTYATYVWHLREDLRDTYASCPHLRTSSTRSFFEISRLGFLSRIRTATPPGSPPKGKTMIVNANAAYPTSSISSNSNRTRQAAALIAQARLLLLCEATETEAWRKRQGYRRTADNLHIYVDLLDRLASSEVQDVR